MERSFMPDISSETGDHLVDHEEILSSWLSAPTPDYVGFATHLQTVADLIELAAEKTSECAQRLTARLRSARDRQDGERTLDLVNTYSVAARQIALEAGIRNEYFRTLIQFHDHKTNRRLAGAYAMLAAAALKQAFMYRDRAVVLVSRFPGAE
ncbi:hypothetical protein [Burkholderia gladioli]|uniref:Uncharacterized protein n=1 Tax=Burkholderia gladioli TaxID=28095 RepID=A0A2A7SE31_BURGA|nr:hypothetical protein [Burkholderia gladioli]MBU9214107.1 hypothetical protein [Burkholderia gladioli]MBU9422130.1 hypothetical protein [Burkholderia gladioli]MDN7724587.1 hypothetical protein [Burkholderia gladioli]MDN7917150.1 hypothetical protein [Burkholderia gladioli]MDN8059289.1 hypothetical protein [Burkholderia gladioli]